MTDIKAFITEPYPFRIAISYLCAHDRNASSSDGYIRFTPYSIEIYHRNDKSTQTDIIYIPTEELVLYNYSPSKNNTAEDLTFDLSSEQTIDSLTKIADDSDNEDGLSLFFPLDLEKLKKIIENVRKTSEALHIEVRDDLLLIGQSQDPRLPLTQGYNSIKPKPNDTQNYDFSVFELNDDSEGQEGDRPFCVETLNKINNNFTQFTKLKISQIIMKIYPGGIILESEASKYSEGEHYTFGFPDKKDNVIGVLVLKAYQIKAFKALGALSPGSTVRFFLHIKEDNAPYLRMLFHLGYFAFLHSIFPIDRE